jgi:hypothetical protein
MRLAQEGAAALAHPEAASDREWPPGGRRTVVASRSRRHDRPRLVFALSALAMREDGDNHCLDKDRQAGAASMSP